MRVKAVVFAHRNRIIISDTGDLAQVTSGWQGGGGEKAGSLPEKQELSRDAHAFPPLSLPIPCPSFYFGTGSG